MKRVFLILICSFSVYGFTKETEKVVVITGVSKGLGHALAEQFIEQGWKIAGCGRSTHLIEQLQREYGADHLFSVVDITDEQAVACWSQQIYKKFHSIGILINNAALMNSPNPLWEVSYSEFTDVIDTNVFGTFNMLRAFTPLLIEQGDGLIINVSSGWGQEGEKLFAPYCASKFAIEGLTQAFASELPEGLIAVSLDPGVINTELLEKAYQEVAANYPTPEQRAKAIVPCILSLGPEANGTTVTAP